MSIWAISDLHLSFDAQGTLQKPMDILNPKWENHPQKIEEYWRANITDEDTVLLCGDLSWAMDLTEGQYDFAWLNNLPGKKIISKGNHDYWWKSITKLEEYFNGTITPLQNNAIFCENYAVCATRGWQWPADGDDENTKIFYRELQRLELSLKAAEKLNKDIIVMLHYPPFNETTEANCITELLKKYNVKKCVFGHLHEKDILPQQFIFEDIEYYLVSADTVDFKVQKIDTTI